jgi:hypothetical protein
MEHKADQIQYAKPSKQSKVSKANPVSLRTLYLFLSLFLSFFVGGEITDDGDWAGLGS